MSDDLWVFWCGFILAALIGALVPPTSLDAADLQRAGDSCARNDGVESIEAAGYLIHGGLIRCNSGARFPLKAK